MKLSIIICTLNRYEDLMETLNSIITQTHLPDELIIVDAGKDNWQKEAVKEKISGINVKLKYIFSGKGLPKQRNIGVQHASGEIISFFDDDVTLDKDYIKEILKVYKAYDNPFLAGVQGIIINSSVRKGLKKIFRMLFLVEVSSEKGKPRILPSGHFYKINKPVGIIETPIANGCTSFKSSIFKEFYFDEKLKGYALGEDDDFSFRVTRKYKILICPNAKLIHHVSEKERKNDRELSKMQIQNHYYIIKKNKMCKNILFLYWSFFGRIIIGLYHDLRGHTFQNTLGYIDGLCNRERLFKDD